MACNVCQENINLIDLSQVNYEKSDCNAIRNDICRSCREMDKVRSDIEQTVQRLRNLLRRQQELKTDTNHVHSSIIRLLPVEIISQIFEASLQRVEDADDEFPDMPLQLEVVSPRMNLGAVCRTWRQIAWSSPQLWKEIILERFNPSKHPYRYRLLEEWMARSKDAPVDIYIYGYADDEYEEDRGEATWLMCLDLLAVCANRWRKIDLHLQISSFEYLCNHIQHPSPIQAVILRRDPRYYIDVNEDYCLFKNYQLCPRSVSLSGFFLEEVAIDWEGVTRVCSKNTAAQDCANILKRATQLQTCRFEGIHGIEIDRQTPETVLENRSLRNLHFESIDLCSEFFTEITLPGLTHFNYDFTPFQGTQDQTAWDNPSLLPFFRRSSFPLTHLNLDTETLTSEYLKSILETVPSLIHLRLQVSGQEEEEMKPGPFLHYLTITAEINGSVSFLPRLESLEYECYYDFPWTQVLDIFGPPSSFGSPTRRPLKSFVVESDDRLQHRIPRDILFRLKELKDVGSIVEFRVLGLDRIPIALEYHVTSEYHVVQFPEICCYTGPHELHCISEELRSIHS